MIKPGTILNDCYEVIGEIGSGGMGEVYLALHTELEIKRSLKRLKGISNAPQKRSQILREGQLLARLKDDRIVKVIDLFDHDNQTFLVMEYVEGDTLDIWLHKNSDRRKRLTILMEAAFAIHAAHDNGIIHGDIKPGNIMVTSNDCVKVLDFGIAQDVLDTSSILHKRKRAWGTPYFMAPELFKGEEASVFSDVYAFGILLYLVLYDEVPFRQSTYDTIRNAHETQCPDPPSGASLPDSELQNLLNISLEKAKEKRLGSASKFAQYIQHYLESSRSLPLRERAKSALSAFFIPGVKEAVEFQSFFFTLVFLSSFILLFFPGKITLSLLYRGFWAMRAFFPRESLNLIRFDLISYWEKLTIIRRILFATSGILILGLCLIWDIYIIYPSLILSQRDRKRENFDGMENFETNPYRGYTGFQTTLSKTPFLIPTVTSVPTKTPPFIPVKQSVVSTPMVMPTILPLFDTPRDSTIISNSDDVEDDRNFIKPVIMDSHDVMDHSDKIAGATGSQTPNPIAISESFHEILGNALENGVNAPWEEILQNWNATRNHSAPDIAHYSILMVFLLNSALYWFNKPLWNDVVRNEILPNYQNAVFQKKFMSLSLDEKETIFFLNLFFKFNQDIIIREIENNSDLVRIFHHQGALYFFQQELMNNPDKCSKAIEMLLKKILHKIPDIRNKEGKLIKEIELLIQSRH
ncbi:serine/threonine protein kinase [Candidatus Sumerlaeota bacterium]|nr:serine/threonine protein kinase [Candidatus Sumerlaeota bacterium]